MKLSNKLPENLKILKYFNNFNLLITEIPSNLEILEIDLCQFTKTYNTILEHINKKKNNKLNKIIIYEGKYINQQSCYQTFEGTYNGKMIDCAKIAETIKNKKKDIIQFINEKLNINVTLIGFDEKHSGGKKNNKKVTIKKSELQKIASKNNISLKKNDGTMKKKIELYKSLKIKKLI